MTEGDLDRILQSFRIRCLVDADGTAAVGGLYEQRVAQFFSDLCTAGIQPVQVTLPDHAPPCSPDLVVIQHRVGVHLIHTGGGRQQTAAHIRDPCQIHQPLDGAVLPVLAVQHREYHVHLPDGSLTVFDQQETAVKGIRREHCGNTVGIPLPLAGGNGGGIAGIVQPASLFADADSHNLVFILWNIFKDVCRRNQ